MLGYAWQHARASAGMALYYLVYSGIRLCVMVEWTIYRSTRRGIRFQPRFAFVIASGCIPPDFMDYLGIRDTCANAGTDNHRE